LQRYNYVFEYYKRVRKKISSHQPSPIFSLTSQGQKIGHKIELNEAVSLKPSIRTFYFFLFHKSSFSQKKSCKNNYFPYKSKILLLFLLPYSLVSITIPQTYFIKNRNFALFSNLQNEAEVVFYQSILGLVQLQS